MIIVPILITSLIHFGWMYSFHLGVKGLNTTLWDTSPRENCWWGNTSCRETPLQGESSIRETRGFGRRRLTRRPLREEEASKVEAIRKKTPIEGTPFLPTLCRSYLIRHPHPTLTKTTVYLLHAKAPEDLLILTLRDNGRVAGEFHCVTCPDGFPLYILSR